MMATIAETRDALVNEIHTKVQNTSIPEGLEVLARALQTCSYIKDPETKSSTRKKK